MGDATSRGPSYDHGRLTIHSLFEAQVGLIPDEPAVSVDDGSDVRQLSYRELNEEAGLLAGRLRAAGVGPESRVAVALERSLDLVVTLVAVLKAGGAYVPLDSDYPRDRREFMLRDSRAAVLVTRGTTADDLRVADSGVAVLALDDAADFGPGGTTDLGGGRAPAPVRGGCDPINAAYVIYTSGSTGTPKGVVVDHRSVANLIGADDRIRIRAGDVVAQFAPVAFDASTYEIWSALCRGGHLVIVGQDRVSTVELGDELARWKPRWLFLTTGLFHLMVDHNLDALAHVGCLITGGDVLSPQHVRAAAALPDTTVYAAYGPTETTTFASLHEASATTGPDRVPIGHALAGKGMRVLDSRLAPLPDGEIGEIYVTGDGTARGYHDRPGLTATRFVADPLTEAPGARMYRTGDLGRRLPDGELEFLGRTDRQVKIRGFRIELGEIEAVLSRHEQLAAVAAAGVSGVAGDKRLVAYVAPVPGVSISIADLRAWLELQLPAYMIPTTFCVLTGLPLDPNGKVDRKGLPYPWESRDHLEGLPSYSAPTTELERLMSTVWADTLGIDKVGVEDNFFALGGDSLRTVDVLARLREHGFALTPLRFLENPVIADLVGLLAPV